MRAQTCRRVRAFGDRWRKRDVAYGKITKRLLRYTRENVQHTAILYRRCMGELDRHRDVPLVPYAAWIAAIGSTSASRGTAANPRRTIPAGHSPPIGLDADIGSSVALIRLQVNPRVGHCAECLDQLWGALIRSRS